MSLNLSPHEFALHPETHQPVLTRVTPYVRISQGRELPPVFLQNGNVYSEGGDVYDITDLPEWISDAIRRLSPKSLEESGFKIYVQTLNGTSEAPTEDKTKKTWSKPKEK